MTKSNNTLGDRIPEEVKEKLTERTRREFKKHPVAPRTKLENGLPYATKFYPEHSVKASLLIKNNAEFRRMISLAIKDNLIKIKAAEPSDKIYINYYWNKFSVKINGLAREFPYKDAIFVNNFGAAIILFNSYAQNVLQKYLVAEHIEIDADYANNILESVKPKFDETVEEAEETPADATE